MRPSVVRLVDLGFEGDFAVSMSFAQSLIQSLTARGSKNPAAEIEFIRTRDVETVAQALQHPAGVIHIMAHGSNSEGAIGFVSDDENSGVGLNRLAEIFIEDGTGINAGTIFADACDSGRERFATAMRDLIQEVTTYIGASRSVSWHESTTFAAAFYGAYFRDWGKGRTPSERGLEAGQRAIAAYVDLVAGKCPFTVRTLKPSSAARKSYL